MPFAKEGALERVGLARACHGRDADVAVQLHELAAVAGAVVDGIGETIPIIIIVNDVRTFLRSTAGEGSGNNVVCATV